MKTNETVLIYIEKDNCFLMLLRDKKDNDINKRKWIGVGGHIEENETPDMALIREVKEETGLTLNNFLLRGKLYFSDNDFEELIYLYTSDDAQGELIDCNEGTLRYINKNEIMNLNLWEGDKYFLSLLLENAPYFEMKLVYNNGEFITHEKIS